MSELSDQFDAPSKRFQAGGHAMAYRDVGPTAAEGATAAGAAAQARPTILCVHGNPTWSSYYRAVAQRFGADHRVIAVDHIGCGNSDKPSQAEYAYTLASHQSNLVALIEHLDLDNVVLLAHDWGGAIGLGAVVRCKPRFRGIMLLNTAAFPPPYVPWRIAACRIPVLGTLGVRGLNLFARAAITMAMSRNRMRPEVARNLLKPYDSWANRVAIDAFVRDIPFSKQAPTYQTLVDLENALPSLADLPSLLVWGMKDWCFRPECLRRFQAAWPASTAVEIADAGHYVIEDAAEETLDAIGQFLADKIQ